VSNQNEEKEDLFFATSLSNNRVLAVLADKFTDECLTFNQEQFDEEEDYFETEVLGPYMAVDYERGLIVKAGHQQKKLIGRTIVLSRNHKTHILNKECEIAGAGIYQLGYSLPWIGKPLYGYVENVLATCLAIVDIKLAQLMLDQKMWQYTIADLMTTKK
jgi:hypothetical protein